MFVHMTYDTQKPLKSSTSGFGLLCIHTQMRGLSDSSISEINVRSLMPNSRWEGNADVCRVYSIKLYNKLWHPKDKLAGLSCGLRREWSYTTLSLFKCWTKTAEKLGVVPHASALGYLGARGRSLVRLHFKLKKIERTRDIAQWYGPHGLILST